MKIKDDYLTYNLDGTELIVGVSDDAFKGMIKANPTASLIISCLKEEMGEKDILKRMSEKYDAPADVLAADLKKMLDQLKEIGVIE